MEMSRQVNMQSRPRPKRQSAEKLYTSSRRPFKMLKLHTVGYAESSLIFTVVMQNHDMLIHVWLYPNWFFMFTSTAAGAASCNKLPDQNA